MLIVIHPPADNPLDDARLDAVLSGALEGVAHRVLRSAEELDAAQLQKQRILFAAALGEYGVNTAYTRIVLRLRMETRILEGSAAAMLIDGTGELYTKSTAAELALAVNLAGCALIGRPLVEGTGSLSNFGVQAKLLSTDLPGAYRAAARELVERLLEETQPRAPELLALHASNYHGSNTMQLWVRVKSKLEESCAITEIGLRNGAVSDCSGCPYTMCLHFGERGRCFYGGVMTDEVWPAVQRCGAMVLLCPNYNDALSANLTAFINRLTGLFRQKRFYDKALFAIVVSGYSGGDIVARQLISALNMNKSFYLPPRFALMETANDPGEALSLPGIGSRLDAFAARIRQALRSSVGSS